MPALTPAPLLRRCSRALMLICTIAAAPLLNAQTSIAYLLSIPPDVARSQVVAPGQAGDFAFAVTSTDSSSGTALVSGMFESATAVLNEYTFVAADPARCALPQLQTPSILERIVFSAGPLAAGESLTCRYRVTRSITSINDLGFRACDPAASGYIFCSNSLRLGSLPDLSLSVSQVLPTPQDSTEPVFRLQLTNHSAHDVARRGVTTSCREFNGGMFDPVPYVLESNFPGGCAVDNGEGCLNFTGQSYESFGFGFGAVPAGGSTSCLVRLRHHAGQISTPPTDLYLIDYDVSIFNSLVALSNGGHAFDPDLANDRATLELTGAPNAIPMSAGGLLTMILSLGLVGLAGLRWKAS